MDRAAECQRCSCSSCSLISTPSWSFSAHTSRCTSSSPPSRLSSLPTPLRLPPVVAGIIAGCKTASQARGLCFKHGAKGVCSVEGCNTNAQVGLKSNTRPVLHPFVEQKSRKQAGHPTSVLSMRQAAAALCFCSVLLLTCALLLDDVCHVRRRGTSVENTAEKGSAKWKRAPRTRTKLGFASGMAGTESACCLVAPPTGSPKASAASTSRYAGRRAAQSGPLLWGCAKGTPSQNRPELPPKKITPTMCRQQHRQWPEQYSEQQHQHQHQQQQQQQHQQHRRRSQRQTMELDHKYLKSTLIFRKSRGQQ